METLKLLCIIWAILLPTFWLFMVGTILVDPYNNWLLIEL